jgi:hypothetical protein
MSFSSSCASSLMGDDYSALSNINEMFGAVCMHHQIVFAVTIVIVTMGSIQCK